MNLKSPKIIIQTKIAADPMFQNLKKEMSNLASVKAYKLPERII